MDIQKKTDIIHQKIYDFLLYIYPLLTKYPKYEKFSLQTATRNAILEMLQEVIKWDKTATKSHLYTVDTALQESKELLRLAHDLKYSAMNARHYGESCRKLKEIGVMLGELIEEVKTRCSNRSSMAQLLSFILLFIVSIVFYIIFLVNKGSKLQFSVCFLSFNFI